MRTAARPTFRKLYAKISIDLEPGDYTVQVSNGRPIPDGHPGAPGYFNPGLSAAYLAETRAGNPTSLPVMQNTLWPVHQFGTKQIVFSTTSWIGGKNGFLGWAYLVVGVMCISLAIAFAVKMQKSRRELGTARFVAKVA